MAEEFLPQDPKKNKSSYDYLLSGSEENDNVNKKTSYSDLIDSINEEDNEQKSEEKPKTFANKTLEKILGSEGRVELPSSKKTFLENEKNVDDLLSYPGKVGLSLSREALSGLSGGVASASEYFTNTLPKRIATLGGTAFGQDYQGDLTKLQSKLLEGINAEDVISDTMSQTVPFYGALKDFSKASNTASKYLESLKPKDYKSGLAQDILNIGGYVAGGFAAGPLQPLYFMGSMAQAGKEEGENAVTQKLLEQGLNPNTEEWNNAFSKEQKYIYAQEGLGLMMGSLSLLKKVGPAGKTQTIWNDASRVQGAIPKAKQFVKNILESKKDIVLSAAMMSGFRMANNFISQKLIMGKDLLDKEMALFNNVGHEALIGAIFGIAHAKGHYLDSPEGKIYTKNLFNEYLENPIEFAKKYPEFLSEVEKTKKLVITPETQYEVRSSLVNELINVASQENNEKPLVELSQFDNWIKEKFPSITDEELNVAGDKYRRLIESQRIPMYEFTGPESVARISNVSRSLATRALAEGVDSVEGLEQWLNTKNFEFTTNTDLFNAISSNFQKELDLLTKKGNRPIVVGEQQVKPITPEGVVEQSRMGLETIENEPPKGLTEIPRGVSSAAVLIPQKLGPKERMVTVITPEGETIRTTSSRALAMQESRELSYRSALKRKQEEIDATLELLDVIPQTNKKAYQTVIQKLQELQGDYRQINELFTKNTGKDIEIIDSTFPEDITLNPPSSIKPLEKTIEPISEGPLSANGETLETKPIEEKPIETKPTEENTFDETNKNIDKKIDKIESGKSTTGSIEGDIKEVKSLKKQKKVNSENKIVNNETLNTFDKNITSIPFEVESSLVYVDELINKAKTNFTNGTKTKLYGEGFNGRAEENNINKQNAVKKYFGLKRTSKEKLESYYKLSKDPDALFEIAQRHLYGTDGYLINVQEGIKLLREASNNGSFLATDTLAYSYINNVLFTGKASRGRTNAGVVFSNVETAVTKKISVSPSQESITTGMELAVENIKKDYLPSMHTLEYGLTKMENLGFTGKTYDNFSKIFEGYKKEFIKRFGAGKFYAGIDLSPEIMLATRLAVQAVRKGIKSSSDFIKFIGERGLNEVNRIGKERLEKEFNGLMEMIPVREPSIEQTNIDVMRQAEIGFGENASDAISFTENLIGTTLNNISANNFEHDSMSNRMRQIVPDPIRRKKIAEVLDNSRVQTLEKQSGILQEMLKDKKSKPEDIIKQGKLVESLRERVAKEEKLTDPKEIELAEMYRNKIDELGARAVDANVLDGVLTDYVTHIVDSSKLNKVPIKTIQNIVDKVMSQNSGVKSEASTKTPYSKHRFYETFSELEKALVETGMSVKTKDIAEIYNTYAKSMERAILTKELYKNLKNIPIGKDNERLIIELQKPGEKIPYGYETINHPSFRQYAVHKDIAPNIQYLHNSTLRNPYFNLGLSLTQAIKRSSVFGSFFHAKSLLESSVGSINPKFFAEMKTNIEAIDKLKKEMKKKGIDPNSKKYKDAMQSIENIENSTFGDSLKKIKRNLSKGENTEEYKGWVKDGLVIDIPNDVELNSIKEISNATNVVLDSIGIKANLDFEKAQKAPVIAQIIKVQEAMDYVTWDFLHPTLKLFTAKTLETKWREKNPNASALELQNQRKEISRHVNTSFGGLNWYDMAISAGSKGVSGKGGTMVGGTIGAYLAGPIGVLPGAYLGKMISDSVGNKKLAKYLYSPNGRKVMQLLIFAPDWTSSTLRQFKSLMPDLPNYKEMSEKDFIKKYLSEPFSGIRNPKNAADYARISQLRQAVIYFTLYNAVNYAFVNRPIWENEDPTAIALPDGTKIQAAKHTNEGFHFLFDPIKFATNKTAFFPRAGFAATSPYNATPEKKIEAIGTSLLPFQVQSVVNSEDKVEGLKRGLLGTFGMPVYGLTEEEKQKRKVRKEREKLKKQLEANQ